MLYSASILLTYYAKRTIYRTRQCYDEPADDSTPKPVRSRSSFLANISAKINAAKFGSAQYDECA